MLGNLWREMREEPTTHLLLAFAAGAWCLAIAALGIGGSYALVTGADQGWDLYRAMGSSGIAGSVTDVRCKTSQGSTGGDARYGVTPSSGAGPCTGTVLIQGQAAVRGVELVDGGSEAADRTVRLSSLESKRAWSRPLSWPTTLFQLALSAVSVAVAGLMIRSSIRAIRSGKSSEARRGAEQSDSSARETELQG